MRSVRVALAGCLSILLLCGSAAAQSIGPARAFLLSPDVTIPTGIAVDGNGFVLVYDSQGFGDRLEAYTPQAQGIAAFDVNLSLRDQPTGYVARDPVTGLIWTLLAAGRLDVLDPQSGQLVPILNLNALQVDASAVYDVATSRTVAFSGGLLVPPFQWGDFAILTRGNQTDFFISALSPANPFIMRLRAVAGEFVSAKALVFSRLTTAGNVNLPRGVAVSQNGTVLTTLPVLTERGAASLGAGPPPQAPTPLDDLVFRPAPSPFETCRTPDGSACSVIQDSAVAFRADFEPEPFVDPQAALGAIANCRRLPCQVPVVLFDRPQNPAFDPVNVTSPGIGTAADGSFYIASGPVGSAECGINASGAMIVVPATLNFLVCAPVSSQIINTSVDVAVTADGRRAYMTLANLAAVAAFDVIPAAASAPGQAASLVASVLPSSRSVTVGTPATAFATIINAGSEPLESCRIDLASEVPVDFLFQATDPATNRPVGFPNSGVPIGAGQPASFVITATPRQAFDATDVALRFGCAGIEPAATVVGLNTLLLSAAAGSVPDVVALAATVSNDGVVAVPGVGGSAAFSVASVNLGSGADIRVAADSGAGDLPIEILVCETDPASGACLSGRGPAPAIVSPVAAGATPTFAIFVTATGEVDFAPAANRVFVRFSDSGGVVRGATSVAVRTR